MKRLFLGAVTAMLLSFSLDSHSALAFFSVTTDVSAPASLMLLALGLGCRATLRRRRIACAQA